MSAPQGLREVSRVRGRGRVRGTLRSRDGRSDRGENPFERQFTTSSTYANGNAKQLKPPAKQNGIRTKSPRTSTSPPSKARGQSDTLSTLAHGSDNGTRGGNLRNPVMETRMSDRYQTLKKNRERERKDAMKNGFLADPDKPTSLAKAITPVGTCQDMCPEFERVERTVQKMVDMCEKESSSTDTSAWGEYMVKRFRRSAAGYDEQLPSDIRPPLVLQKTLNYLFNKIIGGSKPLAQVHKFVWDRTRGIRNDFSIQQVKKVEDIRIAIDCFERIARFHILSLHQLSRPGSDDGEFDHHQEREQLNNTLVSLSYYYDDSRHEITSPNEAEFRAYMIVFELQDLRPDLEDRAQNWPRPLLKDRRVRTAFELYAAAGNSSDDQGPLRPRAPFSIAQANAGRFWSLVKSNSVSYVMACVAEIYFGLIRRIALESIWKAYKGKRAGPIKMEDWILEDMKTALGFDDEEQTQTFCEEHGFSVVEKDTGEAYVDLGSVSSRFLSDSNPRRKQIFSQTLVEQKRLGRTLPAVINGMSALQARSQGLIDDYPNTEKSPILNHEETLFITGDSDEDEPQSRFLKPSHPIEGNATTVNPGTTPSKSTPTLFGNPGSSGVSSPSNGSFGVPTPFPAPTATSSAPLFSFKTGPSDTNSPSSFGDGGKPKFDFFPTSDANNAGKSSTSSNTNESPQLGSGLFGKTSTLISKAPATSFGISSTFGTQKPSTLSSVSSEKPINASQQAPVAKPASLFPQQSKFPGPSTQNNTNHAPSLFPSNATPSYPPTISPAPTMSPSTPAFSNPFPKYLRPSVTPSNSAPLETEATSKPIFSFESSQSTKPAPPQTEFQLPTATTEAKTSLFPPPRSFTPGTPQILFQPSATTADLPKPSLFPPRIIFTPPQATPSQPISLSPSTITAAAIPAPKPAVSTFPTLPKTLGFAFPPNPSPAEQASARPPRPDPRPGALDTLSKALMTDDEGFLTQFVEYTVGPIIACSILQVKEERSWKKAREYRVILLSRKYAKRWRKNAWAKRLLRNGRERRKNFAKSMQEQAQISRKRNAEPNYPPGSSATAQAAGHRRNKNREANLMPPPLIPPRKRSSLPAAINKSTQSPNMRTNNKRKHHESSPRTKQTALGHHKAGHKRSHTVDASAMSDQPRRKPRSPQFPRVTYASSLANGHIISDDVMKQARNLVPKIRTDTTQTDYFRLKALGIDPDTPIVPLTKKRSLSTLDNDSTTNTKARKLSPIANNKSSPGRITTQSPTQGTTTTDPRPANSGIEDLLASMRQVREDMADSISWFQSERAKSEIETPLPPPDETPKQKRLREFKFTPSRTEQRLRATGANGFLPKDWEAKLAESRMSRSNNGSTSFSSPRDSSLSPGYVNEAGQGQARTPIGFAAMIDGDLENEPPAAGVSNGEGLSAEDAIEL